MKILQNLYMKISDPEGPIDFQGGRAHTRSLLYLAESMAKSLK